MASTQSRELQHGTNKADGDDTNLATIEVLVEFFEDVNLNGLLDVVELRIPAYILGQ